MANSESHGLKETILIERLKKKTKCLSIIKIIKRYVFQDGNVFKKMLIFFRKIFGLSML